MLTTALGLAPNLRPWLQYAIRWSAALTTDRIVYSM